MFQKLRLTKCRLEDVAQVASVIAGHASLLPLVLEQMLLEVARVAVGRVADVTLVCSSRAVSRLWKITKIRILFFFVTRNI